MQVIATETGYHDGQLRHAGQEFTIPDGAELAVWMVKKGDPMPVPPKSFVKTAKDLQAMVTPIESDGTLSAQGRREALAAEARATAKTKDAPSPQKTQTPKGSPVVT